MECTLTMELEAALESLSKAVLSQPLAPELPERVNIRPIRVKNQRLYQVERLQDNKAFHRNLNGEELLRFFAAELDGRYRQALLATAGESAQYSLRRNGRYKRTGRASVPRPGGDSREHDREKAYLLREGENIPALVDLGVFRSTALWSWWTRPWPAAAWRRSRSWTSAAASPI